jgi:hypothetical protein
MDIPFPTRKKRVAHCKEATHPRQGNAGKTNGLIFINPFVLKLPLTGPAGGWPDSAKYTPISWRLI